VKYQIGDTNEQQQSGEPDQEPLADRWLDTAVTGSERLVEAVADLTRDLIEHQESLCKRGDAKPHQLYEELGIKLGHDGADFDEVVERVRRLLRATPSTAGKRFVNQLFGGRDAIATMAEMLTPLLNTSLYTYKVAGPQVLVEQEVLGRMAAKVGYPDGEGMLIPGGSLANMTAMIIARNEAVEGIREEGVGGRQLVVYTSDQSHYSIRKNAGMTGIGRRNVREVATSELGKMKVAELRRMIAEDLDHGRRPLMVVATAGTTVLGAFDPIEEIAEVAAEHGLWLHVDGAFGGSLLLNQEHRHLLSGSHLSDSFTWNPHKMMGVPLSCSALLLQRRGLLTRHLNESADYLFQADEDRLNPGTRSIQCGRRNDAIKLWAAWQLHGDAGYDARVARQLALARRAAEMIEADPELVLSLPPESINVCFEVRACSSAEICSWLDSEGRLKIGHGMANGRCAIRLVCVNPELTEEDLAAILSEVKLAAKQVRDE
jgi:glutamate/tyrosine decarboxylase-like PLP-dependent enzyme